MSSSGDYDTEMAARQGCGVHPLPFLDPKETSELVLTGLAPAPQRSDLQRLDSSRSQNNPSGTASKPVSMLGRPRRSRHGVVILLFVVPLILCAFNDGSIEKVQIFWISEEGKCCVFFLETYTTIWDVFDVRSMETTADFGSVPTHVNTIDFQ